MRHLLLSKNLYRGLNALPAVKAASVSFGAAGHTLTVRALQLAAVVASTPGVAYAPLGEREAVYPIKGYAGSASLRQVAAAVRGIAGHLADSDAVQLAQPENAGVYRLRYTRCSLTNRMRLLNDALPEFDFDPFTANVILHVAAKRPYLAEAALRLHGLPIRVGRISGDIKLVSL